MSGRYSGGSPMSIQSAPNAARRRAKYQSCQDARWAAKAGPVASSPLLAKEPGPCWFCPDPIEAGTPIALYVEFAASKWWGHAACVAAARGGALG